MSSSGLLWARDDDDDDHNHLTTCMVSWLPSFPTEGRDPTHYSRGMNSFNQFLLSAGMTYRKRVS